MHYGALGEWPHFLGLSCPMCKMRQRQRTSKFIFNTQRACYSSLSGRTPGPHGRQTPSALRHENVIPGIYTELEAGTEGAPSRPQAAWQKAGLGLAREAPERHSAPASALLPAGRWLVPPPNSQGCHPPPVPYGSKGLSGSRPFPTTVHCVLAACLFGLSFLMRRGTRPGKSKTPAWSA